MFRRIFPWLGLVLLTVSFTCFVLIPRPIRSIAQQNPPTPKKKDRLVVVLDPGHGGQDSGAIYGTVLEKDLTLDVALRAELLLRAAGYATVLTRDSDRYLSLADRAAKANREKNSLFVSIHFNEGERAAASGVETYFAAQQSGEATGIFSWLSFLRPLEKKPVTGRSESLARFLQAALVERTQANNRGTKLEQFYVIAHVSHPAALVEGGFITNPSDATKLATPLYRQQLATAISEGIHNYQKVLSPNEPTLALAAPAE